MTDGSSLIRGLQYVKKAADRPGKRWRRAEITALQPLGRGSPLGNPAGVLLTADTDGTELTWYLPIPEPWDDSCVVARLSAAYGGPCERYAPQHYWPLIGATVWVRKRHPRRNPVSDESERWSTSGNWLLESPEHIQRRRSRWVRGGRIGVRAVELGGERLLLSVILCTVFSQPWSGLAVGIALLSPSTLPGLSVGQMVGLFLSCGFLQYVALSSSVD